LAKGKKYRLQQPLASILPRLQEGLSEYIDHKLKAKRGDETFGAAMERWAKAVMAAARGRLEQAAINMVPEPDGYPGLKEQLRAAKNALVFGPEDRAPHAIFFACGRLYSGKLLYRLEDSGAFVVEQREVATVLSGIKALNDKLKAEHQDRLPYLYGAWKAKKEAFRWIAGTSRKQDPMPQPNQAEGRPNQEADKPKEDGPPKNALTDAATDLVKVWQHIFKSLRSMDILRRAHGRPARYWIVEDIDEFVQEFRTNAAELATVPWATYDFTTMYEALEHSSLIEGCMVAAADAWRHECNRVATTSGLRPEEVQLVLSSQGWAKPDPALETTAHVWYTQHLLREALTAMLDNLFILNGGVLRKQVKGVPMGLNCAGQLANAYGYAVESRWVDAQPHPPSVMSRRYIDDIITAGPRALQPGVGLPSEDDYRMKYKLTSDSPTSLIYIGVRLFVDDKGEAHTVLHDRAVDYPIQVDRYPEASTVANPSQLGGVIMGRLVAAQRTCSRLDLFQDAVAGIMTHAHNRHYPRRLMHSTWTRFLVKYWDAASVTTKELRSWFHKAWNQVVAAATGFDTKRRQQPASQSPNPPLAPPMARHIPPAAAVSTMPTTPPEPLDQLLQAMEEDDCPPPPPHVAEAAISDATPDFLRMAAQRHHEQEAERRSQILAEQTTSMQGDVERHAPSAPAPTPVHPMTVVIAPQMHFQPPAASAPQVVYMDRYIDRPVYIPVERIVPMPIQQLLPVPYPIWPLPASPPWHIPTSAYLQQAPRHTPTEETPGACGLHGERRPEASLSELLTFQEPSAVLALGWPHPVRMEEDRMHPTGKRTASELSLAPSDADDSSQGGSQASQRLPSGPSKRIHTMADWPPEWIAEWRRFREDPDPKSRRAQYNTWPAKLKTKARSVASEKPRQELRVWAQQDLAASARANAAASRAAQAAADSITEPITEPPASPPQAPPEASSLLPEHGEPTSHAWMEGSRIGEASQPGPSRAEPIDGAGNPFSFSSSFSFFPQCYGRVDGLRSSLAGCLCKHCSGAINRSGPGAPALRSSCPTQRLWLLVLGRHPSFFLFQGNTCSAVAQVP
jgi:hypothetical protein